MGTVVAVVEFAFVNCLLFAVIACHAIVVVDYFAVKLEILHQSISSACNRSLVDFVYSGSQRELEFKKFVFLHFVLSVSKWPCLKAL